jgi:Raf kinase inhibitor-like YbhB/YbcL family protein
VPVEPAPPKEGLQLVVPGFDNGGTIPDSMAFCVPAAEGHVGLGPNNSPELKWSQVPEGTKSFVVICHDSEAPTVDDDVNKEGKTVSRDLERADFFHWVLADMTPGLRGLSAGQDSSQVTTGGKAPGPTDYGARGINDYTSWFAGDEKMRGEYGGYDGPCPPWNDERAHVYHFAVYALSVESLNMGGSFTGPQVLAAMEGKVLDKATWSGTYTLNKALRGGASPAPAAAAPAAAPEPAAEPAAEPEAPAAEPAEGAAAG